MTTPKQLQARYPYMFAGPNIGISISRGWMPIFEQLCEDIDALLGPDKRGFHFTQCKEKFGSARWYWAMKGVKRSIQVSVIDKLGGVTRLGEPDENDKPPGSVAARVEVLINAATLKTSHACIVCGEPAKGNRHDGWVMNLCDLHAHQRRSTGKLPDIWFEGEEQ